MNITKPKRLRGKITPPGDKSISHRAAIFNAIANGSALVENFSSGEDCLSTIRVLKTLGVEIEMKTHSERKIGTLCITGTGLTGLKAPSEDLDAGNSGTTIRLMAGVLAGQSFHSISPSWRNRQSFLVLAS